MTIFCGIDIGSKTHEVCMVNEANSLIVKTRRFREDRKGHQALVAMLAPYATEHSVIVGFEATGIYYLNLMNSLAAAYPSLTFYRLNPWAAKKFAQSSMKRNSDDRMSARAIAHMVSERWKSLIPWEPVVHDELACLTDEMVHLKREHTRLANKLHAALAVANPEVEGIFDNVTSGVGLALLSRYPTADVLARARVDTVASLRGSAARSHRVGKERATTLIQSARTSIASDTSPQRARFIKRLTSLIKVVNRQIKDCDRELSLYYDDDQYDRTSGSTLQEPVDEHEARNQDIALISSIKGISTWGAAFIVSHTPALRNFETFEKLNAFVGTCPRYERSGIHDAAPGKMSKRGSRKLRWVLFMETLAGTRSNAVLRPYYHRHLSLGKPKKKALAASMTKMLRLVYGVIHTRTMFDPVYNVRHLEGTHHKGSEGRQRQK